MAEDAVNAAIKSGKLTPKNECLTTELQIIGGDRWDSASFTVIAQKYTLMKLSSHGGKLVPQVMDTVVQSICPIHMVLLPIELRPFLRLALVMCCSSSLNL